MIDIEHLSGSFYAFLSIPTYVLDTVVAAFNESPG